MIAVALPVAARQAGFSIYFTTLGDLVRRLRTAEATGRFNRQLSAHLRPAVLVVDVLGDAVLVTAILDRLLHRCDLLTVNGPSYRRKDRLTLVPGGEPMP